MFNTEVEKATKAADKIRDAQAIDKYVGDIDTLFAGDWTTYQNLIKEKELNFFSSFEN